MKTQISRNSFQVQKRYAGVYQQQGRMLTDADWNNLVDVLKGHLAEALKDVVGNGSPRTGKLTINDDLMIQPGDLYVNGLRASLPGSAAIDADQQPDFPGSPKLPATGPYIVYADVWERSVTALEDPDLRDAGLNGADTCTRTQTMLQVKTCPDSIEPENDIPQHGDAALTLTLHSDQESGDQCDPCAGQIGAGEGRVGNYLFRLEVHAVEWASSNLTSLSLKWSSENGAEQYKVQEESQMPPGFVVSERFIYEFFNLTSEKHLGVHLHPDSTFSPIVGMLEPGYVIPEGDSDSVRRWDGYCELTYDGSAWSLVKGFDKGVSLSTEVADTAPGHVSLNSALSINLEALKLDLELKDKKFVAGDYWLATVREAEHAPSSILLDGASPEGIVHHYLRLARVAADGTVESDKDNADERRKSFPPLTDLWASDVDYQPICSEGIFQNFEGTVKDALDKVCTIQALDVGFTETCNTSIYQGQTVKTVEQALKLLCDVKASQIAYQPGSGCTALPDINTVQAALDALCVRPTSGGCKVTVGEGGQFETLEEAIKTLLSQKVFDICLCLLPGEHTFGGRWEKSEDRLNLSITGCGAGVEVILEKPLRFIGLTSLKLENFALNAMRENGPLILENCTEIDISNLHHIGLAKENPLIRVTGGERVRLEENILEAYTTTGLEKPQTVFAFDPDLAKLYVIAHRDDFLGPAGEKAAEWAKFDKKTRKEIAKAIKSKVDELQKTELRDPTKKILTLDEEVAYRRLGEVLGLDSVDDQALLNGLRDIRDQAHHAAAGIGVVFMDALASVALEDNTIFGSVGFYGAPGENDFSREDLNTLEKKLQTPEKVFLAYDASLQAWDNRITRLSVGVKMIVEVQKLMTGEQKEPVQGLYRTALFESNIIALSDNQLLFENLTLAASGFETLLPSIGWVVGKTAIYTGNRVRQTIDFDSGQEVGGGQMQTAVRDLAKAANLPKGSW